MADYTIKFTDPANGSFVIKPFTTNGPLTPTALVPLDTNAVAANTSIVLLGKGMSQYGERFQESVVHMLEHFAYSTPPAYAIQGQVWFDNSPGVNSLNYYDGSSWITLLTSILSGNLDMNSFRIINLGDPINPQDAMTLFYADANYVNVTGDTMTGTLNLPTLISTGNVSADNVILTGPTSQITLPNPPINLTDGTNKNYVDTQITAAVGGSGFVLKSGDFMNVSANLTFQFGGEVQGLPSSPTTPGSATSKTYVDNQLASFGTVYLRLNGTNSPSANLNIGDFQLTNVANSSNMQDVVTRNELVGTIEQRYAILGSSVPGTNQITLPFKFYVGTRSLQVLINGSKKVPNFRAVATIEVLKTKTNSPDVKGTSLTGIPGPGPSFYYDFTVNVDGAGPTVLQFFAAPSTFDGLITSINTEFEANGINAKAVRFQNKIMIFSATQGTGTDVVLTPGGPIAGFNLGDLFQKIVGVADATTHPIFEADTVNDSFVVSGEFSAIFKVGAPFTVSGSTGNDGTYTILALVPEKVGVNSYTRVYVTTPVAAAFGFSPPSTDGIISFYNYYVSFTAPINYSPPYGIGTETQDYKEGPRSLVATAVTTIQSFSSSATNYFEVAGDVTDRLVIGEKIQITGNILNNGFYTIASFNYNIVSPLNTVISVAETIPSAVVAGDNLQTAGIAVMSEVDTVTLSAGPAPGDEIEIIVLVGK